MVLIWYSGKRSSLTQRDLKIRTRTFTKHSGASFDKSSKKGRLDKKIFWRSKNYVHNNWERTLTEAQVNWSTNTSLWKFWTYMDKISHLIHRHYPTWSQDKHWKTIKINCVSHISLLQCKSFFQCKSIQIYFSIYPTFSGGLDWKRMLWINDGGGLWVYDT